MYFLVIGGHIVLDLQMTLKRENNHSTEFSVFKLVENEILHKILGLFCQPYQWDQCTQISQKWGIT